MYLRPVSKNVLSAAQTGERMVEIDARLVSNMSEDWRHETEARFVADMTAQDKEAYLVGVQRQRGERARVELANSVARLVIARRRVAVVSRRGRLAGVSPAVRLAA